MKKFTLLLFSITLAISPLAPVLALDEFAEDTTVEPIVEIETTPALIPEPVEYEPSVEPEPTAEETAPETATESTETPDTQTDESVHDETEAEPASSPEPIIDETLVEQFGVSPLFDEVIKAEDSENDDGEVTVEADKSNAVENESTSQIDQPTADKSTNETPSDATDGPDQTVGSLETTAISTTPAVLESDIDEMKIVKEKKKENREDRKRSKSKKKYSSLMRKVNKQREGKLAQTADETLNELEEFIDSEKERLDELNVPRKKQKRYFKLLKKQMESIDNRPKGTLKRIKKFFSNLGERIGEFFDDDSDVVVTEDGQELEIKIPEKPASFSFSNEPIELRYLKSVDSESFKKENIKDKIKAFFAVEEVEALDDQYLPVIEDVLPDDKEVVITSEIEDLARELEHNPVKITNWVRSNIDYEPYFGAKKGSHGCLAERVCNDTDTSSLTIALLRASGIPARYKKGIAYMRSDLMWKDTLNAQNTGEAMAILQRAQVPVYLGEYEDIGNNYYNADFSDVYKIGVDWTYVELFYENDERGGNYSNTLNLTSLETTDNLRAVVRDVYNNQWVGIDTTLKNKRVPYTRNELVHDEANFDTEGFLEEYLSYQGELSPFDKYRSELLTSTGYDIIEAYQPRAELHDATFERLPPTLPFKLIEAVDSASGILIPIEVWSSLPDHRRANITISLSDADTTDLLLSHQVFFSEINNQLVDLFYEGNTETDKATIESYGGIHLTPASLVDIAPYLQIGDKRINAESPTTIGRNLNLFFEYRAPLYDGFSYRYDTKYSTAGNTEGIFIAMSKIQYDPELDNDDDPNRASKVLLRGNSAIAREYWKKVQEEAEKLGRSLAVSIKTDYSRAVVTQNRELTQVDGTPTAFDFEGLTIDASFSGRAYSHLGDFDAHTVDAKTLFGLISSEYEASVFRDLAGLEAISTTEGLQYAYANPDDYTVHTINSENESVIDTLTLSDNTKQTMRDRVGAGHVVITPDKPITMGSFAGIVYVTRLPGSSATYAIGEQVQNGGFTTNNFENSIEGKFVNEGTNNYFIFSEDIVSGDKKCRISKTDFRDIWESADWNDSYGLPCMKGDIRFGVDGTTDGYVDHSFVLATDAAKFTGQDYNYWETEGGVRAKLSQYINDLPSVEDRYDLRFSPQIGTYLQGICSDKGFFNCKNGKYETVFYTPAENGGDTGEVYRLKEGFLAKASKNDNEIIKILGFPTSDEALAHAGQHDTSGTYQNFTNGQLYYFERWNIPWIYYTFGKITDFHNDQGGTNGQLGFPTDDPVVRNGHTYQTFQGEKEIGWNLSTGQCSVEDHKRYRCELDNEWRDPARLSYATAHGFLVTAKETLIDGYELLGGVLNALASPFGTAHSVGELIEELEKINPNDTREFLKSAGGATYTALVDQYDTSMGVDGCSQRAHYLGGRMTGEMLLLVVPASKLKAVSSKLKALTAVKVLNRVELVFPGLKLTAKIGKFGKVFKLQKQMDIDELIRIRNLPAGQKDTASKDFWRRFVDGFPKSEEIEHPDYPLLGDRNIDLYSKGTNGNPDIAYELKNYRSRNVSLSDVGCTGLDRGFVLDSCQIAKDGWLMDNKNIRPVWVFVDKGPNETLRSILDERGIEILEITN